MPGMEFRYVGIDCSLARMSEFDVEQYFALTDSDTMAVNERFRQDRRAGAAIQLVFLLASGHTLDYVGTLPRQLLRYIGERLDVPTPTIASQRTLYLRYKTLYGHQVWACDYLGLTRIGPDRRGRCRGDEHPATIFPIQIQDEKMRLHATMARSG